MYMSYYRFEGTRSELAACLSEVEDHINLEAKYEVSEQEINHFRRTVKMFVEFLQEQELLNEEGELDKEVLDRVCESMAHGYEEEDF